MDDKNCFLLNWSPENLPTALNCCVISVTRTNRSLVLKKRQVSNGAKSFKGYFLCRSNWLIVIKAWSSLIENVHFYQSLIATLIWKGHTWTYSLFYKCHDLIHFFWHFLCHKEGIFSVTFSSKFKLFLLQIIFINVIKS